MRKLIILATVFLISCSENTTTVVEKASLDTSIVYLDSLQIDSISTKITNLLMDTKNSDTKIKEIKQIKKENVELKQELVETKAELQEVRAVLADTLEETSKKKKKSFIQKVISTIKKDTVK